MQLSLNVVLVMDCVTARWGTQVQPTKMTLAHQRVLSSLEVTAFHLEHGGLWVQIPTGAQIFFSVSSYGRFFTSNFISSPYLPLKSLIWEVADKILKLFIRPPQILDLHRLASLRIRPDDPWSRKIWWLVKKIGDSTKSGEILIFVKPRLNQPCFHWGN